ncbi:MAG: accessory factor UbiK family protein [Pseudomonadota bacterium]|nr:accessory factor UbiK family protein [Pseudomonadota bacterium]
MRTKTEQQLTMIEQMMQSILLQLETPRADLEKNLRAVLAEMIEKMELVSKAELDRQEQQLAEARRTILALSAKIDRLEQHYSPKSD